MVVEQEDQGFEEAVGGRKGARKGDTQCGKGSARRQGTRQWVCTLAKGHTGTHVGHCHAGTEDEFPVAVWPVPATDDQRKALARQLESL